MAKVIIACRLPNGVIAQVGTKRVRLNGGNADNSVNGFGFTYVDDDFAEAWLKPATEGQPAGEGARLTATKRDGIFQSADMESAIDRALGMRGERSGFERLDPTKAVAGIEPTPETAKQLDENAAQAEANGRRGRGRPPRDAA